MSVRGLADSGTSGIIGERNVAKQTKNMPNKIINNAALRFLNGPIRPLEMRPQFNGPLGMPRMVPQTLG